MKFNNNKKLKLILACIYLVIISSFLYFFFSKYSLSEISSYEFIKSNREFIVDFKEKNILYLASCIFIFIVIWVCLLGLGTPVGLFAGFIFGKWFGTILAVISLSTGAALLYLFGKYFFFKLIKENLYSKFKYLEYKFKKNELILMILYRLLAIVPFPIANLLPVLFNIKIKNYFLGTLIGVTPAIFIQASIGSGINFVISNNKEFPSMVSMISYPEIYLPILGFFVISFLSYIFKKKSRIFSK